MSSTEHPIVECCMLALSEGPADQPFVVTDAGRANVERALSEYFGSPDLIDAVFAVLRFAHFLQTQQASAAAAATLLSVAASTADALRAIGGEATEVVAALEEQSRAFAQFAGDVVAPRKDAAEAPGAGQVRSSPLARFQMDKIDPDAQ